MKRMRVGEDLKFGKMLDLPLVSLDTALDALAFFHFALSVAHSGQVSYDSYHDADAASGALLAHNGLLPLDLGQQLTLNQ